MRIRRLFKLNILQSYVLRQFLTSLIICLTACVSLFIIFELFERMRIFLREDTGITLIISYLFYKIPIVIHMMTPIAVLIAVLFSMGKLSQSSEITAMRACGASLFWIAKPLILSGAALTLFSFLLAETIVPIATQRVDEIYQIDIKKKLEKGEYNKADFWYRSKNKFFDIGLYDSRSSTLRGLSIYELDSNFNVERRADAKLAKWQGDSVGWSMRNITETTTDDFGEYKSSSYKQLPLVIDEKPEDFYNLNLSPESMSYKELSRYMKKLKKEGISVTKYYVDLAAKISFPFINLIVVLIAFPFALISARSGNITKSFIVGISVGFLYYVVHAFSTSLGSAELIPVVPAAWAANILLGCAGGYFLSGMESK